MPRIRPEVRSFYPGAMNHIPCLMTAFFVLLLGESGGIMLMKTEFTNAHGNKPAYADEINPSLF